MALSAPTGSHMSWMVSNARTRSLKYGAFLNDLISFVLIAAVVFFFVVKPLNKLVARTGLQVGQMERKRDCPQCRSRIPADATRCAFCTEEVEPAA